jgi:hypothetical protein
MSLRLVSLTALLSLVLPLAASAQTITITPVSTSTVSYKLQQMLLPYALPSFAPWATLVQPTYDDPIGTLEAILQNRQIVTAVQAFASSTLSALATSSPNQATIDTLLTQVAGLQQQIAALIQAQAASTSPVMPAAPSGSASTTSAIECPNITRLLTQGVSGTDVVNLQLFLASQGFLETASATGFFGKLTEAAVQAWQTLKGIASEGTPATTGFGAIGPKTRAALAACH